jgi:hypothetical protein
MQWWENNIPSLRLSRRLADQTVPISHPCPLTSLSPHRFPHGCPSPKYAHKYCSPKGEGRGGAISPYVQGVGGIRRGTGSLGGATPTPAVPRSIYRLHRFCCVVSFLLGSSRSVGVARSLFWPAQLQPLPPPFSHELTHANDPPQHRHNHLTPTTTVGTI